MTTTPRSIALSAALIGGAMAGFALLQGDVDLAWAIAVSAGVMLVNLGLWVLSVRRLFDAAERGATGAGSAFLISTKMVGIGFMTWGLVQLFPASAVLLGGSVVVLSIILHAAVLTVSQLATPTEA